jgi:hypothetical protein
MDRDAGAHLAAVVDDLEALAARMPSSPGAATAPCCETTYPNRPIDQRKRDEHWLRRSFMAFLPENNCREATDAPSRLNLRQERSNMRGHIHHLI